MPQTNRQEDFNGWYEIPKNPISKAGVFQYLGKEINQGEPNKVYNVYRPAEELSNPEAKNSFRLLPWIDEHVPLLGSEEDGRIPAENKGVHGTTGQDIVFEGDTLYSNIKVYSESMKEIIDSGEKVELSLGFVSKIIPEDGVFEGKPYQFKQVFIRGNHLALVKSGRMGKDVSVLDHANEFIITLDSKEIIKMANNDKAKQAAKEARKLKIKQAMDKFQATADSAKELIASIDAAAIEGESGSMPSIEEMVALFKKVGPMLAELMNSIKTIGGASEEEAAATMDAEGNPVSGDQPSDQKEVATMDTKKEIDALKGLVANQDAAIKTQNETIESLKANAFTSVMTDVANRDALYKDVSPLIGSFDHAMMKEQDVAVKAVKDLGIECESGSEVATLKGYLKAKSQAGTSVVFSMDSALQTGTKEFNEYAASTH